MICLDAKTDYSFLRGYGTPAAVARTLQAGWGDGVRRRGLLLGVGSHPVQERV
jgi:hypothetical protein